MLYPRKGKIMKNILLIGSLILATNSYADWDIESRKIFIKATKKIYKLSGDSLELRSGFTKDSFEKAYIKTLLKASSEKFNHSKVIKLGNQTATVLATKKSDLDLDCKSYDMLTECLYGNYEKLIFTIHTKSKSLYAISHSNVLKFEYNRYGNTGVEQEILIFRGNEKLIAKQANW